jgi:hypothetical protein
MTHNTQIQEILKPSSESKLSNNDIITWSQSTAISSTDLTRCDSNKQLPNPSKKLAPAPSVAELKTHMMTTFGMPQEGQKFANFNKKLSSQKLDQLLLNEDQIVD